MIGFPATHTDKVSNFVFEHNDSNQNQLGIIQTFVNHAQVHHMTSKLHQTISQIFKHFFILISSN